MRTGEKEITFNLYVDVEGANTEKYSEMAKKDSRSIRGHNLMSNTSFKELDKMTSYFTSLQDLSDALNELYNTDKRISNPVIYCDEQDEGKEKCIFYTKDIAFQEDFFYLNNEKEIEKWLIKYISKDPKENITKFRVLSSIYANKKPYYSERNEQELIQSTVNRYIETMGYQGYREAYFTLKELEPERVKKSGIHR